MQKPDLALPQPVEGPGLGGRWIGSYVCSGWHMSVELTLQDIDDDTLWGTFAFSTAEQPSSAGSGSYYVYGIKYRNTNQITLVGTTKWIKQPPGYTTLSIDALYSAGRMTGKTSVRSCTGFEATRVALKSEGLGEMPKEINLTLDYARSMAVKGKPPKITP
jgi:hypothetical protein